ncbi:TPA: Hpt domain-containing protein, partial [Escherichia coli]|nr:Hpt domain-containing protein [Escherichia coli]
MLNGEQWSQLLRGFIDEAGDLIKQAEEYLLQLDQTPEDEDAVNGLFRAMHTLKGSAGLFSLTPLVSFTHHLESLLMSVRDGQRKLEPALISLMLRCLDEIASMVGLIDADTGELPVDETHQNELIAALAAYGAPARIEPEVIAVASSPAKCAQRGRFARCASCDTDGAWHISLRFEADLLRNGFDPASFVRYLSRLGDILRLEVIDEALPSLAEMDPESCYIGLEIDLCSEASKLEIEEVFEFIHDFCTLRILPPNSAQEDYLRLIQELPETDQRIGSILIASGL